MRTELMSSLSLCAVVIHPHRVSRHRRNRLLPSHLLLRHKRRINFLGRKPLSTPNRRHRKHNSRNSESDDCPQQPNAQC